MNDSGKSITYGTWIQNWSHSIDYSYMILICSVLLLLDMMEVSYLLVFG